MTPKYPNNLKHLDSIKQSLNESIQVKQQILESPQLVADIQEAVNLLIYTFKQDNKLLLCGNGGSTCDAMHIAEELTGRYLLKRPPLPAISLSDPSHITCVSNDYGFEEIFSRGVQAYGKKGDALMAFSTSGNSENIIRAINKAKEKEMFVIGLTGESGGRMKELKAKGMLLIQVPSNTTSRIQESHITIGHILIELVENQLFPK